MKTPREILLTRHRGIEPKLDRLRSSILASTSARDERPTAARSFIRDLLLPLRWHLAGMSAIWLFTLALNTDRAPEPAATVAQRIEPSPRPLVAAVRENRRQLVEWLDVADAEPALTRPPVVPQRRSGRVVNIAVA